MEQYGALIPPLHLIFPSFFFLLSRDSELLWTRSSHSSRILVLVPDFTLKLGSVITLKLYNRLAARFSKGTIAVSDEFWPGAPEQNRYWYCFSCNKSVPGQYRAGSKNSRSERIQTINTAVNESKGQGHAEAPFCTVRYNLMLRSRSRI
jgi:hypothetical protein